MSKGKILIILSGADSFAVEKPDGNVSEEKTGFFLTELATPLEKILDAGYDVVFASPHGNKPSIDPLSESILVYMGNYWRKKKEEELIERMRVEKSLYAPRAFSEIGDDELRGFKGVFIPGGHAPLTDLGADPELGRILLHFYRNGKPTAAVCHGPYALLSTRVAPNSTGFAYKGYKLTSWSDASESLVEKLKGGHIEKVESALRDAGADMQTQTSKNLGSVTVDREVVSGANPLAVAELGEKFVEMLAQKQGEEQIESLERRNRFPVQVN
ncbi:ThiJ/PfpI family protein [Coprinopsis cinerea okayama7|uniref:D-lactate dehydratase n=1 Tax=Coprinopsis cinerea (strain Okayama-7 / 130 / ATCC MYA-4618 / FGSC 9003) TaxID=240176 RepID=A8PEG1_COPC7|nr:ThiJ/PfpI family protein [Coprinopsis cinerea okayama7\|eukprot:XP_001840788.1 ThiJ/PfpI family protein [Coprinopsis cinerea okayama7\